MQADIKAITACGGYAACALTAIVDEDTQRVKQIHHLPVDLIVSQAESFLGDVGANCIKTGVLPSADIIHGVAGVLKQYPDVKKVIDPVIVNSVGEQLVSNDSIEAYKELLFPLATLITPNRREAEVLLHRKISNAEEDIKELGKWGNSVIIKSLEAPDNQLVDVLYDATTGEFVPKNASGSTAVPPGAVVVAGSRPMTKGPGKDAGISIYTPVIVKYRDGKTAASVELESLLR